LGLDGGFVVKKVPVEFKGSKNGLYIFFDEAIDFDEGLAHLKTTLDQAVDFYRGSKIIGTKGKNLNYRQKYELEKMIVDQYGIEILSLELFTSSALSNETDLRANDKVAEIKEKIVEVVVEKIVESEKIVSDTHFYQGTLRSGNRIEFPGHVVIIGDVNPGAEIIAEGNIIVLGKLKGFVHAGSAGNNQAFVFSNLMMPTQIRISRYISVPPNDEHIQHVLTPERAFIQAGIVKIEQI